MSLLCPGPDVNRGHRHSRVGPTTGRQGLADVLLPVLLCFNVEETKEIDALLGPLPGWSVRAGAGKGRVTVDC